MKRLMIVWALTWLGALAGFAVAQDGTPEPAAAPAPEAQPAPGGPEPAAEAPPVKPGTTDEMGAGSDEASPTAAAKLRAGAVDVPLTSRLVSVVGLAVMLGLAWLISTNRKLFPWRLVGVGVTLQVIFGLLVLRTDPGRWLFQQLSDGVNQLLGFTGAGAGFVFGKMAGPPAEGWGIAFNILTTIIFFSSLMAVLYHLKIMQTLVGGFAWIMQRTLKISGAESLSAAGNIFVGQTEAPLLVRPYVQRMTESELMVVMVGGFATVAGGVFGAYVGMLQADFPQIAGHLMTASIMSAPAALVIAKIMVPETETPETMGATAKGDELDTQNVIDAAARGAGDGLILTANVAAMLLAFVALVAMLNAIIGGIGGLFGADHLTMEAILGWVLAPLAWLMGVPWVDAPEVGALLGVKTILNEFVAYMQLAEMTPKGVLQDPRSVIIASYALCGFANLGSIAIQIGGIGGIAPERRKDLARLGLRAMIGGNLAAFMTACVAAIIL